MKKIRLFFSLALLGLFTGVFGQQTEVTAISPDEAVLNSLPRLTMPAGYASRPLPYKKDNSRILYYSGVYSQQVWNCNQAGSIWTMFTYEINYLRNLNSMLPENQYSPMAVYNYLNLRSGSQGVTYFDSWKLVNANGIAGSADFPTDHQNQQIWMTGYDKYYRGMKNRVDEVFAIEVGTPDGLLTLKHWLNDHLNGSQIGGVANFQIGSGSMNIAQIPMDEGLEEEGTHIITRYDPNVGHCMTFIGWNDSVRYDLNGDGKFTNHIDINGDGFVTMQDWEIGAMLVLNSWGSGWQDGGKVWVMYRLLAEPTSNGGIWNNAAMVVKPKKTYSPLLTVKTSIRYNQRNQIKIQVGVASDINAHDPDQSMDFPCFNFEGEALPMQGFSDVDSDLIEIGLDITPLINYIPANGEAKIFLDVIQKSSETPGAGRIESFSVMDYTDGTHEFANTDGRVTIQPNSVNRLSVPIGITVDKPVILNEELPEADPGVAYRGQLEADGTTGPYRYSNPATWFVEAPVESSVGFTGGIEVSSNKNFTSALVELPFSFPLYGKSYDQVTIMADGGIVMGPEEVIYPYVVFPTYRFYQNCGIYPFFSTLHYTLASHKVTMESSSNQVVIRWKACVDLGGNQPVEFAAILKPDGTIRFEYGEMDVTADITWISGVSKGDNLDYHLMDNYRSGIKDNSAFTLSLLNWPSWLSLGTNGDLSGTPEKSGTYVLPLKVTDWLGISNYKELPLKVNGGSGIVTDPVGAGVQVWPNPVSHELWIDGYATGNGNLTITIFDLSGRLLFSRDFRAQAGRNTFHCNDLESLTNGIYLFKLTGVITAQGKLLKQN